MTRHQCIASFTRPANITAYSSGDAMTGDTPAALEFENVVYHNGGLTGSITQAKCVKSTNTTSNAKIRLYLFDANVTPPADNAAVAFDYATMDQFVGWIDFFLFTKDGSMTAAVSTIEEFSDTLQFRCPNGSQSLWGIPVAQAGYAPGSGEQFKFELWTADH